VERFIDFVIKHLAAIFYLSLGIGLLLYSCFAKRMSFEGDFPVLPKERKTYKATPEMRKYGIAISLFPLLYGLYVFLSR